MRLLTVTANDDLADVLQGHLGTMGAVERERTAAAFRAAAADGDYDTILVDHAIDGTPRGAVEAIRALRSAGVATPVMLLAPGTGRDYRLEAYVAGADDVVQAPLAQREVVVRVGVLVRRRHGAAASVVTVGALAVDFERREARSDGKVARLSAKEFNVLGLLALRAGCVVSRQSCLDHLHDRSGGPSPQSVDVLMHRLRRKLAQVGCGTAIESVFKEGYVLKGAGP